MTVPQPKRGSAPLVAALDDGRKKILLIRAGQVVRRRPALPIALVLVVVGPPLVANRNEGNAVLLEVLGLSALGLAYLCLAYWNASSSWNGFARAGRGLSGRYQGLEDEKRAARAVERMYGGFQVAFTVVFAVGVLAAAVALHLSDVIRTYSDIPMTLLAAAVTANAAYWLVCTQFCLGRLVEKGSGLEPVWYDPVGDPALLDFSRTFGLATIKAGVAFLVINVGIVLYSTEASHQAVVRWGPGLAMLIILAILVAPQVIVGMALRRHREAVLRDLRAALGPTPNLAAPSTALDLYMFVTQRGILRGRVATVGEYLIALAAAALPLVSQ